MPDTSSEAKRIGLSNDRSKNLKILDELSKDLMWSVNNLDVLTKELSSLDATTLSKKYGFTANDIAVMKEHRKENLDRAVKLYPGNFSNRVLQPTRDIASKQKAEKKAAIETEFKPIAQRNQRGLTGDIGAFAKGVGEGLIADRYAAALMRRGLSPVPAYKTIDPTDPAMVSGGSFGKGFEENFIPSAAAAPSMSIGSMLATGAIDALGRRIGIPASSALLGIGKAAGGFTGALIAGHQGSQLASRAFMPQLPEDVQALSSQTFAGPEKGLGNVAAMLPFFTPMHMPDYGRPTVFGGLGMRRMVGRAAEEGLGSLGSPQSIETMTDVAGRTYFYQSTNRQIDENNKAIEDKWYETYGKVGTPEELKSVGWIDNAERMQRLAMAVGFGGMTKGAKFISGGGITDAVNGIRARKQAREIIQAVQRQPDAAKAKPETTIPVKSPEYKDLVFDFDVAERRGDQSLKVPHRISAKGETEFTGADVRRLDVKGEGVNRLPENIQIGLSERLRKVKPVQASFDKNFFESSFAGVSRDGDFFVSVKRRDGSYTVVPRSFKQLPAELQAIVRSEAQKVSAPGATEGQRVVLNPDKLADTPEQYRPRYDSLDIFGKEFPYKVNVLNTDVFAAVTKIDGDRLTVELPSGHQLIVPKEAVSTTGKSNEIRVSIPRRSPRNIARSKNEPKDTTFVGVKIPQSDLEVWVPSDSREGFKPSDESNAALFEGSTPDSVAKHTNPETGDFAPGTVLDLGFFDGMQQFGVVVRGENVKVGNSEYAGIVVKPISDPRLEPFIFNPETIGEDIAKFTGTVEEAGDGQAKTIKTDEGVVKPKRRRTKKKKDENVDEGGDENVDEGVDEGGDKDGDKDGDENVDEGGDKDGDKDGDKGGDKDGDKDGDKGGKPKPDALRVTGTKQPEEFTGFPYGEQFGGTKEKPIIASDKDIPEEMRSDKRGQSAYRPMTAGEEVSRVGSASNVPKPFTEGIRRLILGKFKFSIPSATKTGETVEIQAPEIRSVANRDEFRQQLVTVFKQTDNQADAVADYVDRWAIGWANEIARLSGINMKKKMVARRLKSDPQAQPRLKDGKAIEADAYKIRYREQQVPRTEKENLELLKKLTTYFYTNRLGAIADLPIEKMADVGSTGFTIGFYGEKSGVVNVAFALSGKENYVTQVHEVNHLLVRSLYGPMYHELASKMLAAFQTQHTFKNKEGIIPEFFEEQAVSALTRSLFMAGEGQMGRVLSESFGEGGAEYDPALNNMFARIGEELRAASEGAADFEVGDLRSRQTKADITGWQKPFSQNPDWYKKDLPTGTPFLVQNKNGVWSYTLAEPYKGSETKPERLNLKPATGGKREATPVSVSAIVGFGQREANIGGVQGSPLGPSAQKLIARWMGHWMEHTNNLLKQTSIAPIPELKVSPKDMVGAVSVQRRTIGYRWWETTADYKRKKADAADWTEQRIRARTYESYLGWLDYGGKDRQGYDAFRPHDEIMQLELEHILGVANSSTNPPKPPAPRRRTVKSAEKPPEPPTKPAEPPVTPPSSRTRSGSAGKPNLNQAQAAAASAAAAEASVPQAPTAQADIVAAAENLDIGFYSPVENEEVEELPERIETVLLRTTFDEIAKTNLLDYSVGTQGNIRIGEKSSSRPLYVQYVDRIMTLPLTWKIAANKLKDQFNGTEYSRYKIRMPLGNSPSEEQVRQAFMDGYDRVISATSKTKTGQKSAEGIWSNDFAQNAYVHISSELMQLMREIQPQDGHVSIEVVGPDGLTHRVKMDSAATFESEVVKAIRRGAYRASVQSRLESMGQYKPSDSFTVVSEYEANVQSRDTVFNTFAKQEADRIFAEGAEGGATRNEILEQIKEQDLIDRLSARMVLNRWARFKNKKWIGVEDLGPAYGIDAADLKQIQADLTQLTGSDAVARVISDARLRSIPAVLHQASIASSKNQYVQKATSVNVVDGKLRFADVTVDDIRQEYVVDSVIKSIEDYKVRSVITSIVSATDILEEALGTTKSIDELLSGEQETRSLWRRFVSETAISIISSPSFKKRFADSSLAVFAGQIKNQIKYDPRVLDIEIQKLRLRQLAITAENQRNGGWNQSSKVLEEYNKNISDIDNQIKAFQQTKKIVKKKIDAVVGTTVEDAQRLVYWDASTGSNTLIDDLHFVDELLRNDATEFKNTILDFVSNKDTGKSTLAKNIAAFAKELRESGATEQDVIKRLRGALKVVSDAMDESEQSQGISLSYNQRTPRFVEFTKSLTLREYALAELAYAERGFVGDAPKNWKTVVKVLSGAESARQSLKTKMNSHEMLEIAKSEDPVVRSVIDHLRLITHGPKQKGQSNSDYVNTLSEYAQIVAGSDATHGQAMYMVLHSAMEGYVPENIRADKKQQFLRDQAQLRFDLIKLIGHSGANEIANIRSWIGDRTLIPSTIEFNSVRSGNQYTEIVGSDHTSISNSGIENDPHFQTFLYDGVSPSMRYSTLLKNINKFLIAQGQPERKILSDSEISWLVNFGEANESTPVEKMKAATALMDARDKAIINPLKSQVDFEGKNELLEAVSINDLNLAMESADFSPADKMAAMSTALQAFARSGGREVIEFSIANGRLPYFEELPNIAKSSGTPLAKLQRQWQDANTAQQIVGIDALTQGVIGTNIKVRQLSGARAETSSTGIAFNIEQQNLTLLDGMVRDSIVRQTAILSDERIIAGLSDVELSETYEKSAMARAINASTVKDMLFTGTYTGRTSKRTPVPGKRFGGDDAKFADHVSKTAMSAIQTTLDFLAEGSNSDLASINPLFEGMSGTSVAQQFAKLRTGEVATPLQHAMVKFAKTLTDTIIKAEAGIVDAVNSAEMSFYRYVLRPNTRIVDVFMQDGSIGFEIDFKNARVIEHDSKGNVRYVTGTSTGQYVRSVSDLYGTEPMNAAENALFELITVGMSPQEIAEQGPGIKQSITLNPTIRTVHPIYWHARARVEANVTEPMWHADLMTDPKEVLKKVGVISPDEREKYVDPVIAQWRKASKKQRVKVANEDHLPYFDGNGYTVFDQRGRYSQVYARLIAHGLSTDKALEIYAMTESPAFKLFMAGDMIEAVEMSHIGGLHDKTYPGRLKFGAESQEISLLHRKIDMLQAAKKWVEEQTPENLERFKFLYDEVYSTDENGKPTTQSQIDKKFAKMTKVHAEAIIKSASDEIEANTIYPDYVKTYAAYREAEQPVKTGKAFTTLGFEDNRRLSVLDSVTTGGVVDLGSGLSRNTSRKRSPVWVKLENPYVHDVEGGNIDADVYKSAYNSAVNGQHDGVVFLNVRDSINSPLQRNIVQVFADEQLLPVSRMSSVSPAQQPLPKLKTIGDVSPMYLSTLQGDVVPAPITTTRIPTAIESEAFETRGLTAGERVGRIGIRLLDEIMSVARFPLSLDVAYGTIQGGKAATGFFTDPGNKAGRRGDTMIAIRSFLGSLRGLAPNMQITINGKKYGIDKIGRRQWISVYNEIRQDPYFEIMRKLNAPLHFINFERRIEAERKRRFQSQNGEIPYEDIVINMMDVDERGNMTDYYENRTFMGSLPLVGMFERQMSLQHDLLMFSLIKKQLQENIAFKDLASPTNPTRLEDIAKNYDAKKMVDFMSMSMGDFQYTSNEIVDARFGRIGKVISAAPRWYLSNIFMNPMINSWASEQYRKDPKWRKLLGDNWRAADIYRVENKQLHSYQKNTYWGTVLFWLAQQIVAEVYGKMFGREDITGMPAKIGSYRVGDWRVAESTGTLEPANFLLQNYNTFMKGQYKEQADAGKSLDETNLRFVSDTMGRLGYKVSPLLTRGWSLYSGKDVIGRAVYREDQDVIKAADDFYTDIIAPIASGVGIEIPKDRNGYLPFTSVLLSGNLPASWQDTYQTYSEAAYWNPGNRLVAADIAFKQFLLSAFGTQVKYDPFVPQRYQGKYRQMHLFKRLSDVGPTGPEIFEKGPKSAASRFFYGRD